jgi:hypothetical protein
MLPVGKLAGGRLDEMLVISDAICHWILVMECPGHRVGFDYIVVPPPNHVEQNSNGT